MVMGQIKSCGKHTPAPSLHFWVVLHWGTTKFSGAPPLSIRARHELGSTCTNKGSQAAAICTSVGFGIPTSTLALTTAFPDIRCFSQAMSDEDTYGELYSTSVDNFLGWMCVSLIAEVSAPQMVFYMTAVMIIDPWVIWKKIKLHNYQDQVTLEENTRRITGF